MLPIRTALLSYGTSGKVFHAPLISANEKFELVGCLERSSKRISDDYPTVKSYDRIEELLNDSIDLVIVNSPNYSHYEYARLCLEAGKHVVIEKPMVLTSKEGRELEQIALKNRLCLSVFHNRRWDSDFLTIKKIFESNVMGMVYKAEFRFDRYRPLPGSKLHKEGNMPGAGIHYDIGAHLIDQALQLFGKPLFVSASLEKKRPNAQAVDEMSITLHYGDKEVLLFSGFLSPQPEFAYMLKGQIGEFVMKRNDTQEEDLAKGKKPGRVGWGSPHSGSDGRLMVTIGEIKGNMEVGSEHGDYPRFYEKLGDAIIENNLPPVTPREAIAVVEIIEAAITSSEKNHRVALT